MSNIDGFSEDAAMLTTHPSAGVQYRDLHVGGLGSAASGALASVTDPAREGDDSWLLSAREVARVADEYIHGNPWRALALVALVGLTAGYLLSRRTNS